MKRSALLSILATVLACAITLSTVPAAAQGNGGQTPFSDIYRRPSVSPYTMMQNQAFNPLGVQNVYQEQVLPQLQIQRQQLEQIRQNQQIGTIQRDVRRLERPPRRTSDTIRPTGHQSTFLDLSHFYPAANQ